ncbi:LysR family transcriptional regulator [Solirubrobacter sp. CPCC 204708]|uniref:LysR substrate-binding domain-containing protein n=1 Tax=Solirubrobacter deserti TaxID=2282478 RepID=A0ABT4RUT2_9ACTN|nr:LysR substrate-binding domain-containing protein [Solirubrobacter deserti]MBE2315940.1 LysR family transcriptional regulator [Solirubrobacter deserti]MDA0142324.1 LysR substrate-binding domain-containing protein [Solirubrobacter deserti]
MELRHLRAFVAVAEEKHFGRAADRLHMAQPPLSQQIRRLESELGVELLHRTTRKVELAPAGEVFLERARALLQDAEQAKEDAQRAARGEVGKLAVGFTGSATYALLPALAAALRQQLPGVELDLRGELLTPAQVQGLTEHTLDLALLRPPVKRRDLTIEVVVTEPLVAVLPQHHRLAERTEVPVEELKTEPFVAYPSHFRSVLHDAVEQTCAAHGFKPNVALEVAETATLVSFVAAGIGVSLVPLSVTRFAVVGAVYRPLAGDPTRVELALAYRHDDASPVLARALEIVRHALTTTGV